MLERREQQRLALEVADRFFVLRRIEMRLDHFLYGAWRVAEVSILGQINRAHAAAADASHNFVARIENAAGIELLYSGLMAAGVALLNGVFDDGLFSWHFAGRLAAQGLR